MTRMNFRSTLLFVLCTLAGFARVAAADTLIVVGVAVKANGERLSGASVRLYATQTKLGGPLAEDRTSDRGVFNLYRTNIAGDLGELYVVYMGDDGKAEPLKVTLGASRDGRVEARTRDLIILPTPVAASVASGEAVDFIAAVTNTEAVLVKAGAKSQTDADAVIAAQSGSVFARTRLPLAQVGATREAIGHRLIDPSFGQSLMINRPIEGSAK